MTGAIDVLNIKLLAVLLILSIISLLAETYPPEQPKALPNVPVIISIYFYNPNYSQIPPPRLPYIPTACTSSIKVSALYF